jgi:hypothetical protein
MNEKYIYTGPSNTRCPVCNKIIDVGPPVIIFVSGSKYLERKWCMSCFNAAQKACFAVRNEEEIVSKLLPKLTKTVKNLIPPDSAVKGYWFAAVPKQGLTLVMEV